MSTAFKGYAIVSADGFIADAAGRMPDSLRFEADWAYFQAALDRADVTLLGRRTHEAAPNVKGRRRLVVSGSVECVLQKDVCTWWVNPKNVHPSSAVAAAVNGLQRDIAVVGGTGVFTWIMEEADYEAFHLTLAHDVELYTGLPLFRGIDGLSAAILRLERRGLRIVERSWFDQALGLELLVFKRLPA